jgi:hypothetical protein
LQLQLKLSEIQTKSGRKRKSPVTLQWSASGKSTTAFGRFLPYYGLDYSLLADVAQRDFAKRFERGKLGFTGDVLQVICVFGRHQKFAKLLKLITVGA